jgi:predicted dehydrogenase
MKALLAGYGGIGRNVYYPELKKLGFEIDILDLQIPNVEYTDILQVKDAYDIAVVCTPNFTHGPIAHHLADKGTKRIFVEKPGLINAKAWDSLRSSHRGTQFHLVKNNLYRDSYGDVLTLMQEKKLIGVDITWFNKNRIPNPGSWFTNKELSFGGVSHDLMPHLYCFAVKLFGLVEMSNADISYRTSQRWTLETITSSDYGNVVPDGTYNVNDIAVAETNINGISLRMAAAWKIGYDRQSVTLFFKDGTTYEWEFGLCPDEAYGTMLQDASCSDIIDTEIHLFLEEF